MALVLPSAHLSRRRAAIRRTVTSAMPLLADILRHADICADGPDPECSLVFIRELVMAGTDILTKLQ